MGQAWDFFWPWCNLKDGRSITWIIGQDRIALQTSCKRAGKAEETYGIFTQAFSASKFYVPTSICTCISPIP
jgi:hypothetical protein